MLRSSVKRLWISSLEESSIKDGFAKLRPVSDYDRLYKKSKILVADKLENLLYDEAEVTEAV